MQNQIHDAAVKGFKNAPDSYERGRPEYPADAVLSLIHKLGTGTESTVVDLGAGTGKLTRLLLPTGAQLIAVEPVVEMRRKISEHLPLVKVLEGTAESIPVADASVDAVVVAQAFHWFKGEAALGEIHRILKPRGRLGLIWNARDESLDWVAKLTRIIDPHEKGAPRYRSGEWKKAFTVTKLFTPLQFEHFRYVQVGPPEMVVDRVASISFVAAMTVRDRALVLEQVRDLIRSNPLTRAKELLELPYRTDVYWCEKQGEN